MPPSLHGTSWCCSTSKPRSSQLLAQPHREVAVGEAPARERHGVQPRLLAGRRADSSRKAATVLWNRAATTPTLAPVVRSCTTLATIGRRSISIGWLPSDLEGVLVVDVPRDHRLQQHGGLALVAVLGRSAGTGRPRRRTTAPARCCAGSWRPRPAVRWPGGASPRARRCRSCGPCRRNRCRIHRAAPPGPAARSRWPPRRRRSAAGTRRCPSRSKFRRSAYRISQPQLAPSSP